MRLVLGRDISQKVRQHLVRGEKVRQSSWSKLLPVRFVIIVPPAQCGVAHVEQEWMEFHSFDMSIAKDDVCRAIVTTRVPLILLSDSFRSRGRVFAAVRHIAVNQTYAGIREEAHIECGVVIPNGEHVGRDFYLRFSRWRELKRSRLESFPTESQAPIRIGAAAVMARTVMIVSVQVPT